MIGISEITPIASSRSERIGAPEAPRVIGICTRIRSSAI